MNIETLVLSPFRKGVEMTMFFFEVTKSDSFAGVFCLGCGQMLRIGNYALIDRESEMIVIEEKQVVCECGNIAVVPLLFLSEDEAKKFLNDHPIPSSCLLDIFIEAQTSSDGMIIN